jgi:TolB protein
VIYFLKQSIFLVLLSISCAFSAISQAALTIEITEGIESAVPIAIVPFGQQNLTAPLSVDLAQIINSDLSRSGYFKALPENSMLLKPTNPDNVKFRNWQALGQEYLVIGQVIGEQGRFNIQFQLFDVYKGEQLMGYRMSVTAPELRRSAHHISDLIYEKLTGIKGVFNSRIAYITSFRKPNQQTMYKLQVADADGYNPKTIAASVEPLMSPAWSPDGKKIAYVSFEQGSSAIYVQTLATGNRERVSAFPGINGAPAWSPDGTRLALTLSKDGSPDIYVLNLATRALVKLTKNFAIDTEPNWSPDGRSIVFTSDRGGRPQLYIMPSYGGKVKRLTFDGDYNARGVFSPNGKSLAMVHANGGDYRIAVMDISTRIINILTAGRLDESPSFAPNGSMVLYASRQGNRGMLAAVSADGSMRQKLVIDQGEVRDPAWSP